MTLNEKEYALLDKIATQSKQDWFMIKQTSAGKDYVFDLEERKRKSLRIGILQLLDGIEGLYNEYFESPEEYETMVRLLLELI